MDPFDKRSIRAGVIRVVQDASYRGNLIEAGLENVKRFAAKKIAAEYAGLYREIMSEENREIRQIREMK